jgi:hypothetical protein
MTRFAIALPVLLGFASLAHAAPVTHIVSPQQLDKIQPGESARQVVAALGKPEFKPSWPDGSYSLAYETPSSDNFGNAQLYINVDARTHKVIGYQVAEND